MKLHKQADIYLDRLRTRKRSPIKGATLAAYESYLRNWINPEIGDLDLKKVENGVMKRFVAKLSEKKLSAATIAGITNCVKGIMKSAIDDNGNCLHPMVWNNTFIDAPIIEDQSAPSMTREELEKALERTEGQFRTLCVLLGGSGLRISEAVALRVGEREDSSYWDAAESKLVIKKAFWRGKEQGTKTKAGVREVDLCAELNEYLKAQNITNEFLFSMNGKPLRSRTIYDLAYEAGIPGFHSFRRYRITHCENVNVPQGMVMFWTGHAEKNVHQTYIKLGKDIIARKDWAEKAGLGFTIPVESQVIPNLGSEPIEEVHAPHSEVHSPI